MYNWEEIYKINKDMDEASKKIGFDPLVTIVTLPLIIVTLPFRWIFKLLNK